MEFVALLAKLGKILDELLVMQGKNLTIGFFLL